MADHVQENSGDRLMVALADHTAFVQVHGRGSFKNAPPLKEFGALAIKEGIRRFVLDMRACQGMDSTFMGVLAGLAVRLHQHNGGEMVMVNLTPRTRGLLSTLGLDSIITTHMAGETPADIARFLGAVPPMQSLPPEKDRRRTTETMIEAHEELTKVTPENAPRFQDVLTYLRQEIKKHSGEGTAGEP